MMPDLKSRLQTFKEAIDFEEKRKILRDLEAEASYPDFWKDPTNAQKVMREITSLK